jgi:hypothetical protein
MALVVKDRVKVSSTTTGTGTFTLGSAALGFQDFSVIGDGNTTYYTITGVGSAEFEVGVGTFTASGTTLSRDTILESSNAGSAVNFSAGAKEVFVTYPAERAVYTDAAGTAITPATASRLGFANLAQGSALSVLGVTGNATADNASIAAGTDHQVLRRSGTAVGFGAVDLAQSAAITGTLPVGNGGTGITSLGTGVATFLGTPSSSNLAAAVTDETGSGSLVFATSPTFVTPLLGTPTSGNLANCTFPTLNQNTTGTAANVTGTVAAANGGTGRTTLTANNVLLGNGTSEVNFVAPSTTGNVLTSNGSTWVSSTPAAGGTTIPSGTVMLFAQTAAPTGFTKLTDQDNAALRVVSGAASTGGSVNFSTAFASQTPSGTVSVSGSAGNTTLSTPQIPAHSHVLIVAPGGPGYGTKRASKVYNNGGAINAPGQINNEGGGGAHSHPLTISSATFSGSAINLAVKYVDVIRATKD